MAAYSAVKVSSFVHLPTREIGKSRRTRVCIGSSSRARLIPVSCSAGSSSWWKGARPEFISAEKIFRAISGATSGPICQFIESPSTILHSLNPRIKLVWLLALVMLPARSTVFVRYGIVVYLALLSIWVLPNRVWKDQLGRVAFLSGIIFISLALSADSAPSISQPRTPPQSLTGLPNVPKSLDGYSYLMMRIGPLQLTRKGFLVASTSACLSFTIFQSASLCLATTTPEQLASALRWFLSPFIAFGAPVAEIILTLLLSLRFINIVFDEVRNVALGIVARRINWEKLTLLETLDVFLVYIQRIFRNIFSHAEQISQAMIVRGFRGDCNSHKIYLHANPPLGMVDVISLLFLACLVAMTLVSESILV
ncbi:cobalt ion transmembrane transporter [Wolffia australiana]